MKHSRKKETVPWRWKIITFLCPYFFIDSEFPDDHPDERIQQLRKIAGWGLTFYIFSIILGSIMIAYINLQKSR